MHWSNLDDVSHLFTLKNPVSSTSSHPSNIQKLRSINHVIVCKILVSSFRLNLKRLDTYPLVEQHKLPWLRLESTNFLRLPTKSLSLEVSCPEERLGQWYQILVALHSLGLAYLADLLPSLVGVKHFLGPLNLAPDGPLIAVKSIRSSIHIDCKDQVLVNTELQAEATAAAVDAGNNDPSHWM
jgi:hypothetical protein